MLIDALHTLNISRLLTLVGGSAVAIVLVGCQPTVKVQPPTDPITINLNIKLDADVRVKLEEQANEDIAANPNIF